MLDRLWDATQAFWDSLTTIHWLPLLAGIAAHVLKLACTSRAWRNVLAAAYPDARVRWRSIFGAYVAGVGVNAVLPARGGDVLRVVLAHRAIPGSTYTTIVSSTVVLTFVDMAMALAVYGFALTQNVLPSLDVLPSLPTFDYAWLFEHGWWSVVAAVVLAVLLAIGAVWAYRRWTEFKERVAQAFSVMRPPSRYLVRVASWQLADWGLRLVTIWFFLGAFGIEQSLETVLLVQASLSLATLVPATPGGIGTEQAFVVYVLRGAEVARSTLLAFSVGMRLTLTAVNVVLGFTAILLTLGSMRFRHAIEQAPGVPPPGDAPG